MYIVLWKDNRRIGSIELTNNNLAELKKQFYLSLIQTDITGTQHYNVWGKK